MLYAFVFFLGLLGGYVWGRKAGRQEGLNEGLDLAPLEFKKRASETGNCPICGESRYPSE